MILRFLSATLILIGSASPTFARQQCWVQEDDCVFSANYHDDTTYWYMSCPDGGFWHGQMSEISFPLSAANAQILTRQTS